jgi:hypothetical protein
MHFNLGLGWCGRAALLEAGHGHLLDLFSTPAQLLPQTALDSAAPACRGAYCGPRGISWTPHGGNGVWLRPEMAESARLMACSTTWRLLRDDGPPAVDRRLTLPPRTRLLASGVEASWTNGTSSSRLTTVFISVQVRLHRLGLWPLLSLFF